MDFPKIYLDFLMFYLILVLFFGFVLYCKLGIFYGFLIFVRMDYDYYIDIVFKCIVSLVIAQFLSKRTSTFL